MLLDLVEVAFGLLNLISTWRFSLCTVVGIGGGVWCLHAVQNYPARVVTALCVVALGIVFGMVLQKRYEVRLKAHRR